MLLFIDNQKNTNPKINLAIEEYVLRNLPLDDSYLLFYINEPSIIIGKNQNTIEEINAEYVQDNGIHVIRRLSGGGAVYHDLGNLNFSFITKDDGQSFHNFRKFTQPVVQALNELGVECELTGRNDIQVGERKISGNAQFVTKGRMFSHGTLLFDSEIEHVVSALKVNAAKIQSKGTKSIRSRVANISEFLQQEMTIEQFKQELLRKIFGMNPEEVPQYRLTDEDWVKINQISEERYQNWDWNYGYSPKSNIQNMKRFPVGIIDLRMDVAEGRIKGMKVFGDFFGVEDVSELESKLQGVKYEETEVREALDDVNIQGYFGAITLDNFIDLMFLREQ
ncbi:lipoate--protein ligase [Paenibacillus albiflavus]|uniref:lipoate--protein ligase n=1 Tax=Paenibacillus albiflavus TaxID=2545760 RepID=A0A4V2WP04_9BACL|nr:lipoate--protein ligase [Paenibacillus albiflavus]TCZ77502.1 lipoate--protein ligase [Paenibacillus albiflavus]